MPINILVIKQESKRFFSFNIFEVVLTVVLTVVLVSIMELGIFGYSLSLLFVPLIMFGLNIMIANIYSTNTKWMKVIKVFYGNIIENFLNFYEAYVIQATTGIKQVALYTHSKQYLSSINMLDKSFFQAYAVDYLKMLNGEYLTLKIFRIMFYWYTFILFIGVCIVYLGDDAISFLTHGKLTESAKYLAILYISIFFKSNQQQYNFQLLFNKVFIFITTIANLLIIICLSWVLITYKNDINTILYVFIIGFVLKNIMVKVYAIYNYRLIDISELLFWVSLIIYLIILQNELHLFDIFYNRNSIIHSE